MANELFDVLSRIEMKVLRVRKCFPVAHRGWRTVGVSDSRDVTGCDADICECSDQLNAVIAIAAIDQTLVSDCIDEIGVVRRTQWNRLNVWHQLAAIGKAQLVIAEIEDVAFLDFFRFDPVSAVFDTVRRIEIFDVVGTVSEENCTVLS